MPTYNWREVDKLYLPENGPTSHMNQPVFVNSYTGDGMVKYPENTWADVDVSEFVPPDANSVFLAGIMIITQGTASETTNLTIAFRTTSNTEYAYIMQTIAVGPGNGSRSNAAAWVTLDENKKFQMKWTRNTSGTWPTDAAVGFNLRIQAVGAKKL